MLKLEKFLTLFIGIGAIGGAAMMWIDPSGAKFGMEPGLLLIPISYLPSKAVWCLIGLLAIQPVELFCLLSNITIDHSRLFEIYGNTLSMHEHGTFFENVIHNLRYGFELNFRYNIYSGRMTQLLCLFI